MNSSIPNEQLEDIIEMALDAAKRYGTEWNSALVAGVNGNFHAITSDTIQAVVVQANDDSRDASWLCDYLESVSPGLMLSLLRELQQYRKTDAFRENSNSSTETIREIPETSTNCPKCGDRGSYHCPQMLGTVECECTLPAASVATQFKPVADLYGITSPTGGETTFTFDAVEATGFARSGWSVQEYVELQRLQEAVTGNPLTIPDGYALVPINPTEDMVIHGFESEPDEHFSEPEEWAKYDAMTGCQQAAHKARLCWSAMLVAAPKYEPK